MAGAQSHAFGDVPAKGFSRVTSEEPLVTVRPESLISGVRHSSACWSRACPQSCLIVSLRFHDLVQPVPPSEVSLGTALNYGPAVSAEKKGTLAVPLLASSFPVLRAAIGSGFLDLRHFLGSLHLSQRPVCPHLGNNKYSFRSKCWWSPCSLLVLCSSGTEPLNGTGTHPTVSIFGVTVQDEPKPLQNSCSNCCPGSARRDSCAAPAGHRLLVRFEFLDHNSLPCKSLLRLFPGGEHQTEARRGFVSCASPTVSLWCHQHIPVCLVMSLHLQLSPPGCTFVPFLSALPLQA